MQETFVRAWRAEHDPTRGSLRTWLYAIATNICLDMLRSAQRRARAIDLDPAAELGPDLGAPLPEAVWLRPAPDHRVLDPAELTTRRETVRLAFLATHLDLAGRFAYYGLPEFLPTDR